MKNYYKILGISENASSDEITGAFRKLARQYHPDAEDGGQSTEKFQNILEAKKVLLDTWKRIQYDKYLYQELHGTGAKKYPFELGKKLNNARVNPFSKQKTGVFVLGTMIVAGVASFLLLKSNDDKNGSPNQKINASHLYSHSNKPTEINKETVNDTIKRELASRTLKPKNSDGLGSIKSTEEKIQSNTSIKPAQGLPPATIPKTNNINQTASVPLNKPVAFGAATTVLHKKWIKPTKQDTAKGVKSKLSPGVSAQGQNTNVKKETGNFQKELKDSEMRGIVDAINREKVRLNNNSNCVQICRTKTSNVSNSFMLADLLKDNGYIISGRETIAGTTTGISIDANAGCIRVVIGTFETM